MENLLKKYFEKREKSFSLEKALSDLELDLFVPQGAFLRGEIESQGLVHVEGELRGTLTCPVLYVAKEGKVIAEVRSELVYLAGSMRGTIRAHYCYLPSGGDFQGDLFVRALWVETGGKFKGKAVIENHGVPGSEAQLREARSSTPQKTGS